MDISAISRSMGIVAYIMAQNNSTVQPERRADIPVSSRTQDEVVISRPARKAVAKDSVQENSAASVDSIITLY